MKLITAQFLETEKMEYPAKHSVLVVVIGKRNTNALQSLKRQIFTNFRIYCIHERTSYDAGEIKLNQIEDMDLKSEICKILEEAKEDYVLLLDGEDSLLPNALLEYVRYLENNEADVVYADECTGNIKDGTIYNYHIKHQFEYIYAFQSMYTGKAVIWKTSLLQEAMGQAYSENFDTLMRELFQLCVLNEGKVGAVSLVLLVKASEQRDANQEKRLQPLLQKNIQKYTKWNGGITKSAGYNPFAYEMVDLENCLSTEIIIVEEHLKKVKHLISQLKISYPDSRLIIAGKKEDFAELEKFCCDYAVKEFRLVEQEETYVKTLEKISRDLSADIQILMSEQIRWMNITSTESLMMAFNKPEVVIASPQIATEGDQPKIVYAGGETNSLGLASTLYKGRTQAVQPEYDLAWLNHSVVNLNRYCLAIRKSVWQEIFPMHASICDAEQFARELSYVCKRKNLVCEYVGQSSFWVEDSIESLYVKKDGIVKTEDNLQKTRLRGSYWHWLSEYSDIIEAQAETMKYVERGSQRFLEESFKVYGLEYAKESGKKRVLVFSHELSLTGAPLVLVQAVESLKKMNFDVLVVSPIDGPLKDVYLEMEVPVIIDPELYINYEYIRMVYDFEFVIACTVCLYPVIEVLGNTDIPVLWWVHDSRMGYVNWLRYELPKKIGENIRLYCGGEYAQNVILEYRPQYSSKILLYGLEDFAGTVEDNLKRSHWGLPEDKVIFANIGQIISRKGQDVLVDVIERLPDELRMQSVFVFVGGVVDRKIYNRIMQLEEKYPENVRYIKQINHEELKQFYREIDCIVCSSLDDPLPAFVAEGLLMSRTCICSKNTAFSNLIEDGKNGFLFESGNREKLYQCVREAIENRENLEQIGKEARRLYENTFTKEIFEENFAKVIFEDLLL